MAKIKLTVISPVHIGTGREFQGGYEYIYFPEQKRVSIIDEEKVLNIIGKENINQWVSIINKKEDLFAYLKKRKPDLTPDDVEYKGFGANVAVNTTKTIREHMALHTGEALIPGSSIKGAIRSAVLGEMIRGDKQNNFGYKEANLCKSEGKNRRGQKTIYFNDSKINNHYLADDAKPKDAPNKDYFRFIKVRDFSFSKNATICDVTQTLNLKSNDEFEIKKSVSQLCEVLQPGQNAVGEIVFDQKHVEQAVKHRYYSKQSLIKKTVNVKEVFKLINSSTNKLLKEELKYFNDNDAFAIPNQVPSFISNIEALLKLSETCLKSEDSALLRLGFGSGYYAMTGNWTRFLEEELLQEVEKGARKDWEGNYETYELPKSRKLMQSCFMGYVKLTIVE